MIFFQGKDCRDGTISPARKVGCLIAFLAFALIVTVLETTTGTPVSSSLPQVGSSYKMGLDGVGCREMSDEDNLTRFIRAGEKAAYEKAFKRLASDGKCKVLGKGTTVLVQDVSVFSGLSLVREQGEDLAYWVPHSFIEIAPNSTVKP